ncbi:MAG: CHAT domain-containing protein [Coleofasciculus sp. S288]|nr:CHAT domain-containing protein [Coleofasciculus sp. S288]
MKRLHQFFRQLAFFKRYAILFLLILCLVTTVLPVTAQQHAADASTQLEQGLIRFQAEQFSEAIALWQQSARRYQEQGARLNQALSLSYLSLAHQNLGQWQDAQTAITQSLTLLQSQQNLDRGGLLILGQALNTRGHLQFSTGQAEAALNTWKQAEATYDQAGDATGSLGTQINQAQAMQTLGLYRRSQTLLEQINQTLQAQPYSPLKAAAFRSLGVALQVVGDLQKSQDVLEQSLAIAQQLNASQEIGDILFSLGNTARALQDYEKAVQLYQKAAEQATNPLSKLEAQLNQLSLSIQTKQWNATQALLPKIQAQLAHLPPSRTAVHARVNLAESLMAIGKGGEEQPESLVSPQPSEIAQVLVGAIQEARTLKDPRAEAYALGELGQLYKQIQQWTEAQNLTQNALQIAQAINASDITYRWEWQLGQILKQQGKVTQAKIAYTEAVNTLQSLRTDLVAINPDVQFSFRESVEPVYRELVELLLQPKRNQGEVSQENLKQARQIIESLQLAELDNFFRQACLSAKPEQIDQVDPNAAVIYPIILPDRLAVILSLPGQPLRHYETRLPQRQVENILDQALQSLNPAFSNRQRLQFSQQVYDWLIRPTEDELATSGIKTLVFVLDGALRNLPMAALYDGQQYLIEKYSIAISQGLQLLEPRSLVRERLKVLTAGLTEPRQGFSPLPAVEFELKQIASEVPSQVLLNQEFIKTTVKNQIQATPFPVVHLATHGQFSSKAENTFLLTWDGRINVKDLDELLQSRERVDAEPIELLVLSACQTATGDKRATLGLAGVAVRSGARSTLATLWSVQDQSTAELMVEFYRNLAQPEVSKAEALRQAQLSLLKKTEYKHPFFWASFVLVGNWL